MVVVDCMLKLITRLSLLDLNPLSTVFQGVNFPLLLSAVK